MKKYRRAVVIALALISAITLTLPRTEHFALPLYAQGVPEGAVDMRELPWLHVEVSTSYSWFHQKSTGRAWVTAGKQDTTPVKVAKLCLQLAAHDTTVTCESNVDEITLQEKKKGIQIKKRTAIVSAWAENPNLDTVTVKMEP